MSAPFPTRRDESWRYGDMAALAQFAERAPAGWNPAADHWARIDVPAGEVKRYCQIAGSGPALAYSGQRFRISLGEGARLEAFFTLNGMGPYDRLELDVTLAKGAHFELGGVILAHGSTTQEIVTTLRHDHPSASSRQIVRAVAGGGAVANFLGKIAVARDAQQTDAEQSFKAMLLDRKSAANAKPELEIFADDVKCAHGCAIGELDAMAEYYMASRGLPPAEARKLLLTAFVAEAFSGLSDRKLRESSEIHVSKILELVL